MTDRQKMTELVKILDAKKAGKITAIDVGENTIIATYFVICTANSSSQLNALADEAMSKMNALGTETVKAEGKSEGGWVLVDFGGVILHVFSAQMREFYDLERLWSDAEIVDIKDLLTQD